MIFHMGKTVFRVHGLLLGLWVLVCVTGGGGLLFPALLSLSLHEGGHLLAARRMRLGVEEIEITPYGGVIAIKSMASLAPGKSFLLAAAGPLASLAGCALAAGGHRAGLFSFPFALRFFRANLLLVLVNLLPALPLDGGRMLRAFLCRLMPYASATRALVAAGYGVGFLLCAVSLFFACRGQVNLAPAFAGVYLLYAAALEGRQGTARYLTALIARRQKLEIGDTLPVAAIAAGADTPAKDLLRRLTPGKFHLIYVLSPDGMESLGTLDEKAFCDALFAPDDRTLAQCIQKKPADPSH